MTDGPQQPAHHSGAERSRSGRSERIDRLCDRFEQDWLAGVPPRLEDYLEQAAQTDREELFRELLSVELWHRTQSGASPAADEYLARFPDRAEQIAACFGGDLLGGTTGRYDPFSSTHSKAEPGSGAAGDSFNGDPAAAGSSTDEEGAEPSEPPQVLGRYRVTGVLGRGAFGTVYRAWDDHLQRAVAVKVPRFPLLADSSDVAGFQQEARMLAALDHPGIVPVYDYGRTGDGRCYVVSKYIEGGSLQQQMQSSRPSCDEAARIIAEVADALQHAHQRGLVHRDVKPANILLDPNGRPLLADFGLALHEDEQRRRRDEISGSPAYMAPEQVRGEAHHLDGRADVWALGVVLYELLTGRRPFSGRTPTELFEEILQRDPKPPRQFDDTIPRELESICLTALRKHTTERYTTARDMAEDLRQFLTASPPAHGRSEPAGATAISYSGTERPTMRDAQPAGGLAAVSKIDFGAELDRLTDQFTGREWIVSRIRHWVQAGDERVFLLTGDPGAGKSALLACVISRDPAVAAHHFCIAGVRETLDPIRFVKSIAAQLADFSAGYRDELAALDADVWNEIDAGTLFRKTVCDPLRAVARGAAPLVIAVDALDESLAAGGRTIVQLLHERMDDCPAAVRFLLSSRSDPRILDFFSRFVHHDLGEAAEALYDCRQYVSARFQSARFQQALQQAGLEPAKAAQMLAEAAGANFLYAKRALESMNPDRIAAGDFLRLPKGLAGAYHDDFQRLFPSAEQFRAVRPMLEVLVAARQPLSAEEIAEFAEQDRFDIEEQLEMLAAFFPESGGAYRPFHKSMTDWLAGAGRRSSAFRVDVRRGHCRIAEKLLAHFSEGRRTDLIRDNLLRHLLAAEMWDRLEAACTDLPLLSDIVESGRLFNLIRVFNDALRRLPPGRSAGRTIQLVHDVLRTDAHFLARHPRALFQCLWNRLRWFEADDADEHYRPPNENAPLEASSSVPANPALKLLCEQWRRDFERTSPGRPWMRSLRPPADPLGGGLKAVFKGHQNAVRSIAVSPDGRWLASASMDFSVRVWNLATGEQRWSREIYDENADVAYSPDGKYVAAVSHEGRIHVWQADSGEVLQFHAKSDGVPFRSGVAFLGDALVVGGRDGVVRILDLHSGEERLQLTGHSRTVTCCAAAPSGAWIVTGSKDETIRIWDAQSGRELGRLEASNPYQNKQRFEQAQSGRELARLEGHQGWIHNLAVSPDERFIASTGGDRTLILWDVSGSPQEVWSAPTNGVHLVAFSSDGRRLITDWNRHAITSWDVQNGRRAGLLSGHQHWITSLAVVPGSGQIVTASADRTIRVWVPDWNAGFRRLKGHKGGVTTFDVAAAAAPAVTSDGATICVWNMADGLLINHLLAVRGPGTGLDGRLVVPLDDGRQMIRSSDYDPSSDAILAVALSPDGRHVAASLRDRSIRIYDAPSGEELQRLSGHTDAVSCVVFSGDGRFVASGSWDGTVRIWNLNDGRAVHCLTGHNEQIEALQLLEDGRRLASFGSDVETFLWDWDSGRLLHGRGELGIVRTTAVSPDGRLIALGFPGSVQVRRTADLGIVWQTAGDADRVWQTAADPSRVCVEFSGDGRVLAGSPLLGPIRFWDVGTWDEAPSLDLPNSSIEELALFPDGRTVACRGWETTAMIIDAAGQRPPAVLKGHVRWVCCLDVSPDGRTVATGSTDNRVILWDAQTGSQRLQFTRHAQGLARVCFLPGGRIASADVAGGLYIWNESTGEVERHLQAHAGEVRYMVPIPATNGIATVGRFDPEIRIWDLNTGRLVHVLAGHQGRVNTLAATPDGRFLFSGGRDFSIRKWNLETGQLVQAVASDEFPDLNAGPAAGPAAALDGLETVVFDAAGGEAARLPLRFRHLVPDNTGRYWMGISGRDVCFFELAGSGALDSRGRRA